MEFSAFMAPPLTVLAFVDEDDVNAVLLLLVVDVFMACPVDEASLLECVYVTYNEIVSTPVATNSKICSGIASTVKGGANNGS